MMTCPKCGASVGEDKAFCQDCGTPMSPASEARPSPPVTDFGATIIVPRGPAAGTPAPPPPRPATAEARPIAPPIAGGASPSLPGSSVAAATAGRPSASPPTAVQQPNQNRLVLYVLLGAGALLLTVLIVIGLLLFLTD